MYTMEREALRRMVAVRWDTLRSECIRDIERANDLFNCNIDRKITVKQGFTRKPMPVTVVVR